MCQGEHSRAPKPPCCSRPALAGTAYLEVLNKLLWPDLDQQLELPQLPLQQLLVRQLKSDFAGGRNADRHVKLLQFSACDSAGRGENRDLPPGEKVCLWWPKCMKCAK